MREIFVSYKRINSEVVYALVNEIKDIIGAQCWVDVANLRGSCNYDIEIAKAIEDCKFCLFIISKELSLSVIDDGFQYILREAQVANDCCHKTIIPVSIDGTSVNENAKISIRFELCNGYDITNVNQKESFFKEICNLLNLKPIVELSNYFNRLQKYNEIPKEILEPLIHFSLIYPDNKLLQSQCIKRSINSLKRDYTKIKCIDFKWNEYNVSLVRFPIYSFIYSFWELTHNGNTIACGLEQDYVLESQPHIRVSHLKYSSNPRYTTSLVDKWI